VSCRDADKILAFSTDAVNSVVEAYCPIVKKHMNDEFTQEQKEWQQIRRGRWA
jgi:coproporphyrinogen III oxidase